MAHVRRSLVTTLLVVTALAVGYLATKYAIIGLRDLRMASIGIAVTE